MPSAFLLPGLGWIVADGFWRAFIACLIICPIIPQLLGVVCHSYWPPLNPKYQFTAYMPANLILGFFNGLMATTLQSGFTVPLWVREYVLAGAFVAYAALNVMDLGVYTKGQMASANKVYHNALYWWYTYFTIICFAGMWSTDASLLRKVLITVPGVVWAVFLLVVDNCVSEETKKRRFKFAHAYRYCFIWTPKRGFHRLLRRAPDDAEVAYV